MRVSEANQLLQAVQVQVMQSPTPQLFELEKQALERWNFLRVIEESYFKKRSRVNWLKEGDQDTTYFYRIVQTRLRYYLLLSDRSAWFVEEVLQGNLSNLWTTTPNRRFSWQVNKLLKLSPLLYQWIKLRVGNGLSCRFWTDNWSEVGTTTSESPIPLERNFRLHRQTFRPPSSLIRQIDRQIKDRILSLRTSNPAVSSIMMQRWLA
ncbi:BnaC05g34830D [Brassica napus]|uniref:BnaC05g34830D protein n=1 Tax=Brassica napus TaxID=3708 RepID=A0A078GGG8_BRANA|nr:BnaC05g34830D [Brassica napus]